MKRSRKLTVAGILDLAVGSVVSLASLAMLIGGIMAGVETPGNLFPVLGFLLLPPGALAVVGGIYALRRKRWMVALIFSVPACPFCGLTIPAIILIALSKNEFS